MATNNTLYIGVGNSTFTASLLDNPTVTALHPLLPLHLQMSELNGNEKYADLPVTLPTAPINPGPIRTGDLMLYGSRTLVLWYANHSSSYTYTRIGSIDDPAGLAAAVGASDVAVRFATDVQGAAGTTSSGPTSSRAHVSGCNKRLMRLLTGFVGVMFVLGL